MEVLLSSQARKYLDRVDDAVRSKLCRALDGLSRFEGDIVRLAGVPNIYRLKIHHYRIIFELIDNAARVYVIEINTRTNIKYREYGRRK